MYVNLSKLPSSPKEYRITLGSLYGGLNTSRLPHEISSSQMSDCLNVYWKYGMVRSRNGKEALDVRNDTAWSVSSFSLSSDIVPLTMHNRHWHNRLFMAFTEVENEIGYIVMYDLSTKKYTTVFSMQEELNQEVGWSKQSRGSFFEFGEKLYYKNRNLFLEITYSVDSLTGEEAIHTTTVTPYIPIVQINTNANGTGDLYQPENRLSPLKEVWYNGDTGVRYTEIPCDGKTKIFHIGCNNTALASGRELAESQHGDLREVLQVYIGAALAVENTDYTFDLASGTISVAGDEAPAIGLKVSVKYRVFSYKYNLPVNADSVISVLVKNLTTGEYAPAQYQYLDGRIIFPVLEDLVPAYADANVLNSFIKVVYYHPNEEAYVSINECNIASVYGATGIETNCVIMAGSEAQPNALFWSGNDSNGANVSYFPMTNYNLVGTANDPITAFGRQQNKLVIFQENRLSAAEYAYANVDGRLSVSMNVRSINDGIGCDLPMSVQLIDNNLVWAHTKHGVLYLKDSNYAYESLVVGISDNVNDAGIASDFIGLYADLRANKNDVCSLDDGSRYWLCVGEKSYVWDYSVQGYTSNVQKLSWWLMDNIGAASWALDGEKYYALSQTAISNESDSECWLFTFGDGYSDFGEPMQRLLQLQTQTFGTYDRLKNVNKMIFVVDGAQRSHAKITYFTDYGARNDLTDIDSQENGQNAVHVRKPKCLHVHTFAVCLSTQSEHDLNLTLCQIFYTYRSRTKAGIRI